MTAGDDPRTYAPTPPSRRFFVWLVVATVIVCVGAAGLVVARRIRLRHEAEARVEEAEKGRPVTVVRVDRTPAQTTLDLPGEIHGFIETPVYAKIAGYLDRIVVDKGDRVKAGDLLAVLESPELDQQVRNAQANERLKRVTDERYQALKRSGVVSLQDADQARSDAQQAEATLRQLQAMAEYKRITADFDGAVTRRDADPGTLIPATTSGSVGAATPILSMASLNPLRVYVDLPQSDAPFVKDGDEAVVTVAEYPGRRFMGSVTRHPQALAAATRTMLVEVDLKNDDGALLPGMYARIAIALSGRETAPRIPDDALVFRDGKTWVAVVEGDRLRVVPVTLGYDDGRMSEVIAGLSGGELIAMNVGQTARDGELVQVRDTSAQSNPDAAARPR